MKKENIIEGKSFQFSLLIIELYKSMIEEKEFVIAKQVLRSGTSIGANVTEAIHSMSRKEFVYKLNISLKEARETEYWLRLIKETKMTKLKLDKLFEEIKQVIKILTSIIISTKANTLK